MQSPDQQPIAPPPHQAPPPAGTPHAMPPAMTPMMAPPASMPVAPQMPPPAQQPISGAPPAAMMMPPPAAPPAAAPAIAAPPAGATQPQAAHVVPSAQPATTMPQAVQPAVQLRPIAPDGAPPPTAAHFSGATSLQLKSKRLRIGEVLIQMGIINDAQLELALSLQKTKGERLGKVLISEGLASSVDIAKALAHRLDIDFVELGDMEISREVIGSLPFETCRRHDLLPIEITPEAIVIAMADPTNVFAVDEVKLISGREIRVVTAAPEAIDLLLSGLVNLDAAVAKIADSAEDWTDDHVPLEDIRDASSDAPAIQLVNQIITKAVIEGASDLHFEPQAEDMVVRFRKDGVLSHITTVPHKLRAGVTSRIKIMAQLDISERRRPQDGRVPLMVGDRPIDLRVAVLPTVYGEKSVMRVLDKGNVMLTMEQMGFLPQQLDKLRHCYTQPYGCLLVTGPTGSGKSTTLYGALNEVNDIEKNIITVEDPVEYRLRGINQVQVNVKAGMTFGAALRSILRCDPDIVMIGEMRDQETASIGIEAALTGHLVLSTLHTNTAPGAIPRLIEMGIEPYIVSSSVLGVLAQRLARRLCTCKETWTPDRDYLARMGFPPEVVDGPQIELCRNVGCQRCGGSGYKGRVAIHEVMMMSEEIAHAASEHASAEDLARIALSQGMIDLTADGIHKILAGHTTMEELQRIVQH